MKPEKTVRKPRAVSTSSTSRKSVIKALSESEKSNGNPLIHPPEIQEAIKLKAYELYVERGYVHGNHEDDWLEAERIVLKKKKK